MTTPTSEEPERIEVTPDMVITPRELAIVAGGRRSVAIVAGGRRSGKTLALYRAMLRYLEEHPDGTVRVALVTAPPPEA
jgi:hypothetical protein